MNPARPTDEFGRDRRASEAPQEAGFDEASATAGLLPDAVERGTLTAERLRREMGDAVSLLVLALTEDDSIDSFAERKAALQEQVRLSGPQAVTIFAADKLSDINGLRRGIDKRRSTSGWAPPSEAWPLITALQWR